MDVETSAQIRGEGCRRVKGEVGMRGLGRLRMGEALGVDVVVVGVCCFSLIDLTRYRWLVG